MAKDRLPNPWLGRYHLKTTRRAAASNCVAAFRDQDPCPGPQCVPLEHQEPRVTGVMKHDDLL
ncbi:MAG: hypothetical protein ACREYF_08600, partial [Gammaproteobacteria bacterium]